MPVLKRITKYKTYTFIIGLLLFFVVINYSPLLFGLGEQGFLSFKEIVASALSAVVGLIVIGIVYEWLTKTDLLEDITNKFISTFLSNSTIINKWSAEYKTKIIEEIISSMLGGTTSRAVFHGVLKPYLKNEYNYRLNYHYTVSYREKVEEGPVFSIGDVTLHDYDHYWVDQYLSYSRPWKNDGTENNSCHILIAFFYDESTLDSWFDLQNRELFFREVLYLKEHEANALRGADAKTILEYINKVLKLSISIKCKNGNEPIDILESYIENKTQGFFISFKHFLIDPEKAKDIKSIQEIENESLEESERYRCTMKFTMPQRKDAKKFVVVFPEPTYKPLVTFSYLPQNMRNITAFSFFPEKMHEEDDDYITYPSANVIYIRNNRWVLPRSGAVFMWD